MSMTESNIVLHHAPLRSYTHISEERFASQCTYCHTQRKQFTMYVYDGGWRKSNGLFEVCSNPDCMLYIDVPEAPFHVGNQYKRFIGK